MKKILSIIVVMMFGIFATQSFVNAQDQTKKETKVCTVCKDCKCVAGECKDAKCDTTCKTAKCAVACKDAKCDTTCKTAKCAVACKDAKCNTTCKTAKCKSDCAKKSDCKKDAKKSCPKSKK